MDSIVIYSFIHFEIYVIFSLMRMQELKLSFLLFFIQNPSNYIIIVLEYFFKIKNLASCRLES